MPKFEFLNDPREVSNGNAQPPTPNTVSHSTNHEEVQSAESPCFASLTTSIPLDSPTVHNEVQPNSTRVSFSDIQKVLSIPEMQKSKRSEESQVVTSSLYKQSLIDNINEQKNKPLKAKKKQLLVKKVRRRKLLRLRQLLQETWTIHNALCGMDFGRNYYQERNGCCAQYARNGCMKNVAPL